MKGKIVGQTWDGSRPTRRIVIIHATVGVLLATLMGVLAINPGIAFWAVWGLAFPVTLAGAVASLRRVGGRRHNPQDSRQDGQMDSRSASPAGQPDVHDTHWSARPHLHDSVLDRPDTAGDRADDDAPRIRRLVVIHPWRRPASAPAVAVGVHDLSTNTEPTE